MVDSNKEFAYYVVSPKNFKPVRKCYWEAIYPTEQDSKAYVLSSKERIYQVFSKSKLTAENLDSINFGKEYVSYQDNYIEPKQPKKVHVLRLGKVVRV